MASGKKTSKNQKTGNKGKVITQEKRVKPKKETVLVEATEQIINQLFEEEKDGVFTTTLNGKPIVEIIMRYGKKYIRVKNT